MYLNAKIQVRPARISQQIAYTIILLLFIPTFVPRIIEIPNWYAISNLAILTVVFWFALVSMRIKRIGRCTIYACIFCFYLMMVTAIKNPRELYSCATRSFTIVCFIFVIEYMIYRIGIVRTMEIWFHFCAFISFFNALSMIFFPNGLYHTVNSGSGEETVKNTASFVRTASSRVHWLLGHQTGIMKYLLPVLCISLLYYYLKRDRRTKRKVILVYLSCIIQIVIANSVTNYILILCFISFICLLRGIKKWMVVKPIYVMPFIIVIYGVLLNMSGELSILSILSQQFGRTVEISSRILVWTNTVYAWLENPIIGCGYLNESSSLVWNLLGLANPHSGYFWILYEGGIIAMAMFVYFCVQIYKGKNLLQRGTVGLILIAGVLTVLVGMITDDYLLRTPFTFVIFVFAYHVDKIWMEMKGER